MKRRKLIQMLDLPARSDARALAESLTDDFNVASIVGSNGEFEIQFVSPADLVVVISSSQARFFIEPLVNADADEEEDEEPDDPHDVAEEISVHLARRVGTLRDDDETGAAPDDDDNDEVARRVVERLLREGLLELVTPRSRTSVEEHLAHIIAHERVDGTLCDDLADVKGVAELYTSDEQLYEILAACRKKPVTTKSEPKARVRAASKTPTMGAKRVVTSDKPTTPTATSKTRKAKTKLSK